MIYYAGVYRIALRIKQELTLAQGESQLFIRFYYLYVKDKNFRKDVVLHNAKSTKHIKYNLNGD